MKNLLKLSTFCAALLLGGCAGLGGAPPLPGEPEASVLAKLGKPGAVYPAGADKMLEYATGPAGQFTYMARIGADGALKSFEQVLTDEKFATIKIGAASKRDVLATVGRPTATSHLSLSKLEVWSYRYKQSGVWDSMMYVGFDHDGVVRMMQSGPDRDKEERHFFW